MARLSIFNSNTLTTVPKPATALRAAVLGLIVVRLVMYLADDVLLFSPQDEQRYYAFRNDARYADDDRPQPTGLILGTSRFTVLDSGYVARPLNLDEKDVLNYSVPSLTFWHVKRFLERNPTITKNLDLVIIDLLPFQLAEGDIFSHEAPYYVGESTYADAFATKSPRTIFIKAADTAWPAWSQRRRVPEWIATARIAFSNDATRRSAFLHYQKPFRAMQKRKQAVGMTAMHAYTSERISPVQTRALRALPKLLPKNATLVLIWLPVGEAYRKELMGAGSAGEMYRDFKRDVLSFDDPKVRTIWVESPDEMGLLPSEYIDEVHFGEKGMAKAGMFLERQLASIHGGK